MDQQRIYAEHAAEYDALVGAEDCDGHLLPALEAEHGLARVAIRTDYLFPDVETAATITGFFFGDAFSARVRREGWRRVPECTGLWSKRV